MGIFEVFLDGFTTMVIIRPSIGSYVFNKQFEGLQGVALAMMPIHNQQLILAKMMGFDVVKFRTGTPPLTVMTTVEGATTGCTLAATPEHC